MPLQVCSGYLRQIRAAFVERLAGPGTDIDPDRAQLIGVRIGEARHALGGALVSQVMPFQTVPPVPVSHHRPRQDLAAARR